jgi:predicted nuclease of restriction endonuclease-like (RecB) superfamily
MGQSYEQLVDGLAGIHTAARQAAARSIDRILTLRNWLIGASLFEYEQNGADRAAYGERLVRTIAEDLARAGCSGLSFRNLNNYRQFALAYPDLEIHQTAAGEILSVALAEIVQTVTAQSAEPARDLGRKDLVPLGFPALRARLDPKGRLAWRDARWLERLFSSLSFSHLLELSRIDDSLQRAFYELHCLKERWSVRELRRQRDSLLYERTGLSRDKAAVLEMAGHGLLVEEPGTILRDPYVLEFLGLEQRAAWNETELEEALLEHLQQFLLELGRDFCFVQRQFRVTVGGRHHFIDLLFFHRRLRCLIAVDLKVGAFRHEDAGQMNFYLNYLRENVAYEGESPPVGLILCAEKDAEEVHYATAGLDRQLFVSRYLVALPSEEQLRRWLQDEQAAFEARTQRQSLPQERTPS